MTDPNALTDKEISCALFSGAAIAGSVSVLAAGLITLPVPNPWALPAWVLLAVVFCTGSGWLLGYWLSYIEGEEER